MSDVEPLALDGAEKLLENGSSENAKELNAQTRINTLIVILIMSIKLYNSFI
tara:strand:- start:523 stop:678 length:156 start_codon:yes stop_codon:yes gene_type:complete